ncbi:MAG: hypothetical protein KKB51_10835 [Candidatus Riflebacteria bacterium]|nr:hypothetical protein [Candidatus Riflebacteria bacterium]
MKVFLRITFVFACLLWANGAFSQGLPDNSVRVNRLARKGGKSVEVAKEERIPQSLKFGMQVSQQNIEDFEKFQNCPNVVEIKAVHSFPKEWYAYFMGAEDLDNDGKKEIIFHAKELVILNHDWTLRSKTPIGSSANGRGRLVFVDFEGAGKKQIVIAGEKTSSVGEGCFPLYFVDSHGRIVKELEVEGNSTEALFQRNDDGNKISELVLCTDKKKYTISAEGAKENDSPEIKQLINENKNIQNFSVYKKDQNTLEIAGKKFNLPVDSVYEKDVTGDGVSEIIVLSMRPVTCVTPTWIFVFSSQGALLCNYRVPTWINVIEFVDFDGDSASEILISQHHTSPLIMLKVAKN